MNSKVLQAAVLATSLVAATSPAIAANEQCDQPWRAARGGDMHRMHDTRMEHLHTALQLTPDQESAWAGFAAKMSPVNMAPRKDSDRKELSAPDRMDKMLEDMKLREDSMVEKAAATRQFYGTLNTEQQRIFDREFQSKGGGRHLRRAVYHSAN